MGLQVIRNNIGNRYPVFCKTENFGVKKLGVNETGFILGAAAYCITFMGVGCKQYFKREDVAARKFHYN